MTDAPPANAAAPREGLLDSDAISRDFPAIVSGARDGGRLAYLDSASSAQKPAVVLDAMREVYEHHYANVHRGVYRRAVDATARFEGAREITRRFLGAASPREVVFTRGTTEAVNLVALAWGLRELGAGDIVLATEMEHHSNLVPWQQVCQRTGAEIRYIPVDDHGVLVLDDLDTLVDGGKLRLVTVAHVSNSLGTINDVACIAAWAHERDALVFVDGAQGAPHRALDVQAMDCDFYAFSGHKLGGPSGIGALWGRESVLSRIEPFQYGGEMIRRVEFQSTTFNTLPWKFEAGTPAIVEAIGMGAAIEYLEGIGLDAIEAHEHAITSYALDALAGVPGLQVVGPPAGHARSGVISFALEGTHPHDIAEILDASDVNVRAGHHCTQPLLRRLGHAATARASAWIYTTTGDVDRLIEALHEVRRTFKL